jgi:D-aminopeptidase
MSSLRYQWMKVNGVEVGEIAIDAAVAGELGVPVIFVSSDSAGIKEAKEFLPYSFSLIYICYYCKMIILIMLMVWRWSYEI